MNLADVALMVVDNEPSITQWTD